MTPSCPKCGVRENNESGLRTVIRSGQFWRKSDGRSVQRFRCLTCKKTFSQATFHPCFRQKKRHKNEPLRKHLSSGLSLRRAARVMCLNRKTVVRKFRFLAAQSRIAMEIFNLIRSPAVEVMFDELETFEHTKCKPLSLICALEAKTCRILAFEVAQMPANGRLAAISRKKYGPRPDLRSHARTAVFEKLKPIVIENATFRSDSNPHYPKFVITAFPKATHITVKGKRGSSTGQGELKKVKFDPLFSLNHTFAKSRADMNRLFRKTWCTTKNIQGLIDHFSIFAHYHNQNLNLASN